MEVRHWNGAWLKFVWATLRNEIWVGFKSCDEWRLEIPENEVKECGLNESWRLGITGSEG